MTAIIKKEINSFFSSPIGYLAIALFLIINGLFLWVFEGAYNILDAGFADLSNFFQLAPMVLLFLIPAVTMRAFSDEKRMGTLELLLTKPIGIRNIVIGKFLGAVILIGLALLPSLLYILTIDSLSSATSSLDIGSTLGSYIGLLFLVFGYTAIGIFTSALAKNQIVAFICSVLICFLLYYGFEGLSAVLSYSISLESLGMKAHFDSMARGVIDTRDVLYFISLTSLFIILTVINLKEE